MAMREVSEAEITTAQVQGWRAKLAGAAHLSIRRLGDGTAIYLDDLFFGNLRLGIGPLDSRVYDETWCYQQPQTEAAWRAALGWDGEGEPEGWYRHPQSGRRRPGGDAAAERVHW